MPQPIGSILVVDDEPQVADILVAYFTDLGYAVATAQHGGDAVMLAAVERPDVILLDILMPGVDGVEVLRRVRALDPTLPVIMVTGNADERTARDTLTIGAFDYVPKPFSLPQLLAVVEAALASSRSGERWTPAMRAPHTAARTTPLTRTHIVAMLREMQGDEEQAIG
jgi:two-component system, OmpR family, response regulator ResD